MSDTGLVTVGSHWSFAETVGRCVAARHGLGLPSQPAIDAMAAGLAAIARDASQNDAQ